MCAGPERWHIGRRAQVDIFDLPWLAALVFWQKVVGLRHLIETVVVCQQAMHGAHVLCRQCAIGPQVFGCSFVVEHQHGIGGGFVLVALPVLNQSLGVQRGIGAALQHGRPPRQVNQKTRQKPPVNGQGNRLDLRAAQRFLKINIGYGFKQRVVEWGAGPLLPGNIEIGINISPDKRRARHIPDSAASAHSPKGAGFDKRCQPTIER